MANPMLAMQFWPLVVMRLSGDVEPRHTRTALESVLARQARFVLITDMTELSPTGGAALRAEVGEMLRSTAELRRQYQVAEALVLTNALVRGAITAVQWLAPPIVPTRTCNTLTEAADFVEHHAHEAGLDVRGIEAFRAERLR